MALFERWVEDHGSPSISVDETGSVITVKYWALWDDVWIGLPEIRSSYPGNLIKFNDTKMTNYSITNRPGGEYANIVLVYKSPQKGSSSHPEERKDTATIHTMSDGSLEKSIETKRGDNNYKMFWNFSLAKRNGVSTGTRPGDWNTQTEDTIPESISADWKWVKDITDVEKDWSIDQAAVKKGVESYLISSPIVSEKTYHKKQSSADSIASNNNTRATPGNTFGKSGGEWLIISSNVYFEDGFWVAERQFQFADIWDHDLYN